MRLQQDFVDLAIVLDAFSRKVVGWALDRSLAAQLAVDALQTGDHQSRPAPGLVHHSDRGIQYALTEYGNVLDKHRIIASMSRLANPWDNAKCESFMKTLKQEEIQANNIEILNTCGRTSPSLSTATTTGSDSIPPGVPNRQNSSRETSCLERPMKWRNEFF